MSAPCRSQTIRLLLTQTITICSFLLHEIKTQKIQFQETLCLQQFNQKSQLYFQLRKKSTKGMRNPPPMKFWKLEAKVPTKLH